MLRRITIAFLLVGICLAQDNISRMDQVVHGYTDSKLFMGSVLVAREGKVLLSKGYGFADMEWDVPNSPTTKFRLGSVTKQFTAACILLLEERGKLKLDNPVKQYMTDAPAAWDKITIFNLLTHTSGIPNYTGFYDAVSTEAIATTPEKLVARFRDRPLEFQPGEKWNYSNSGYVLLGYLIEKISQQGYGQFVQENIFNPLGMKDSGYDSQSAIIPHRASGYVPSPKGVINASYIDMSVTFAAGGLYSTTEDLLRWEQGLMGGKLLSPASLQKMITPFKSNYALGVGVNTVNGRKVISHTGSVEGFYTELEYYPEDKLTVVVLANLYGQAPEYIARKLAAVAHGENVPLPTATKEITVSPALLESYVGTYELTPSFNIVVTLEGGQLMTQATGALKVPLFAESETKFFLKVVDAQVEFFKNEKGEVTHLMLHQNGRDIKGTKKAQLSGENYDQAIQNFNEAIRVNPKSAGAFNGRGVEYFAKGDYGQAIQDFSEAVRLNPNTPRALLNRGLAHLYAGHFSDAQQDFSRNLQFDPTDPYAVMWLYLSRAKAGTDGKDELKTNAAALNLSNWPGPVIQLYLGQSTPENVSRAAGSKSDQKCEYSFYVGEYRALRGERPEARALFRSASDACPKDFVEYIPSLIELKELEKKSK